MAKRTITYNYLWIIEMDIENIYRNSPALYFFNESRFTKFLQNAAMDLKILHSRVHEIQKKYIVHETVEGNEVPVHADLKEGEKKRDWKYLESAIKAKGLLVTGDDVKIAYSEELNAFLNRSCDVEI